MLDVCSNIGRSAFLKSFYFQLLKKNCYSSLHLPEQKPLERNVSGVFNSIWSILTRQALERRTCLSGVAQGSSLCRKVPTEMFATEAITLQCSLMLFFFFLHINKISSVLISGTPSSPCKEKGKAELSLLGTGSSNASRTVYFQE